MLKQNKAFPDTFFAFVFRLKTEIPISDGLQRQHQYGGRGWFVDSVGALALM